MEKTWNDIENLQRHTRLLVDQIETSVHGGSHGLQEVSVLEVSEKAVRTKEYGWLLKKFKFNLIEDLTNVQ